MKILIKEVAKSQWQVRLDQHVVTFRSEAEALAFTRTLEARLCAPHRIPEPSQQRAAGWAPKSSVQTWACASARAFCKRRVSSATLTTSKPHRLMTMAIGTALPSCNTPTNAAAPAAMLNCRQPSIADALPARAP